MFSNPTENWYTDTATISRVESYKVGSLTKKRRITIAENVPCRVYSNAKPPTVMKDTAAQANPSDMLACDNEIDIRAGDEITVVRGGMLGSEKKPQRYFAGLPVNYYEPIGGVVPNLAHQEVPISGENRN